MHRSVLLALCCIGSFSSTSFARRTPAVKRVEVPAKSTTPPLAGIAANVQERRSASVHRRRPRLTSDASTGSTTSLASSITECVLSVVPRSISPLLPADDPAASVFLRPSSLSSTDDESHVACAGAPARRNSPRRNLFLDRLDGLRPSTRL